MKKFLKSIYNVLPFKKEIYSLVKKIYSPGSNVYQHLHFKGNFSVPINSDKAFNIRHHGFSVENDIFWKGIFGYWEKVSLSLWAELCENSNVIFDIGANTGVYSLIAKTVNPSARVFAFEPVERVFEKLSYNNSLNNFDISSVRKAMSNYDGIATIYDRNSSHIYSVTVNKDISDDKENSIPVEIETIRLDTFIDFENIPHIDLMKIDVETHEVEVLEGFGKYLGKYQPTMLIEVLDDTVAAGISKYLDELDYQYYNIDELNGIKQVEGLSKSDFHNFLICKKDVADKLKSLQSFLQN